MENLLTAKQYEELTKKLEANELYQKSKSIHKLLQFRRFFDSEKGKALTGQIVRKEDGYLLEGDEGFDEKKAKLVIYNFADGFLHSENDQPAVQYPGHWEIWEHGLLKKVVADGGDTEEYWENGVPVRIETNLAERRRREAENGN